MSTFYGFPPLEPRGAHVVIYGSGTSSEMLGIGGREQREPECVNSHEVDRMLGPESDVWK